MNLDKEQARTMGRVMQDLSATADILDALADRGLEDANALRMLSRLVGDCYVELDELTEPMEA